MALPRVQRAEYLPNWSYSGRIEAVVWSIPILTIMLNGKSIWIMNNLNQNMMPMDQLMKMQP